MFFFSSIQNQVSNWNSPLEKCHKHSLQKWINKFSTFCQLTLLFPQYNLWPLPISTPLLRHIPTAAGILSCTCRLFLITMRQYMPSTDLREPYNSKNFNSNTLTVYGRCSFLLSSHTSTLSLLVLQFFKMQTNTKQYHPSNLWTRLNLFIVRV